MKLYMTKILHTILFIIPLGLLFSSCELDNGDDAYISELGAEKGEYIVTTAAGVIEMPVLSNTSYVATIIDGKDWATIEQSNLTGDDKIKVAYHENTHFPRMLGISIFASSTNRYDTIYLKQHGAYLPEIKYAQTSVPILSAAGKYEVDVDINFSSDEIPLEYQLMYYGDEEKDWIADDFVVENGKFVINAKQNTSDNRTRTVKISTIFHDEWNRKTVTDLYVLQARSDDLFGNPVEFEALRNDPNWIGNIPNGYIIEGIVVSDKGNPNVADTPNTTNTITDYTMNDKTAYIQSLDGKYGFRILASSPDDNIFERYSRVQVSLDGATLSVENNPNRYTIAGVSASKVVSAIPGSSSDLPLKEMSMADLKDDDIYTYVTLKDCEFPIRKGSLMPINEGYAHIYNAHRVNKYPILVRDKGGDHMYMFTNTKCEYRRSGNQLPYGSGKLSGVIVHETYTRFEFEDTSNEDTYGNIGTYQIRHLTPADIKFNASFSNSFSELLTEFRYSNITGKTQMSTSGVPSTMQHLTDLTGDYPENAENKTVASTMDYSYLGPVGATNAGNVNGNGISDDSDYTMSSAATNSDGKGGVNAADKSAWAFANKKLWWNHQDNEGEGIVIETSTTGIITTQLSLQIAQWNWDIGSARFWEIHWTDNLTANSWQYISSYSIPDIVNWNNTLLHQTAGPKYMNFRLPLAMLGKSKVYIRLRPAKDLASNGQTYATVRIVESKNAAFTYAAIRYNK